MFCSGMQASPQGRVARSSSRHEEPGPLVYVPRGEGGGLVPRLGREGRIAAVRFATDGACGIWALPRERPTRLEQAARKHGYRASRCAETRPALWTGLCRPGSTAWQTPMTFDF